MRKTERLLKLKRRQVGRKPDLGENDDPREMTAMQAEKEKMMKPVTIGKKTVILVPPEKCTEKHLEEIRKRGSYI